MNNRIESALAWKELRQSMPVVIAFIGLTAFIMANLWYLHHYSHHRQSFYTMSNIQDWVHYFAFFISLGLGYLLACGNRLMEATEQVESFLFVRPVEKLVMVRVYFLVGLTLNFIWFVSFLLILWVLFGAEMFNGSTRLMNLYGFHYTYFVVALLTSYTIAFTFAQVEPSLIGTSISYISSYVFILAVCLFEPSMRPGILLRWNSNESITLVSLILVVSSICVMLYMYRQKEVR